LFLKLIKTTKTDNFHQTCQTQPVTFLDEYSIAVSARKIPGYSLSIISLSDIQNFLSENSSPKEGCNK